MKKPLSIFLLLYLLASALFAGNERIVDDKLIKTISEQMLVKEKAIDGKLPEYTKDGEWQFREKVNWFSGMTAGEHFVMYELTGKDKYKHYGLSYADMLIDYAGINYTHDMGFIFMPSVVEAYKLTGEEKYKKAGIQAADMLKMRNRNRYVEFIRAWGVVDSPKKAGWMIIDTMMNLELLFWASEVTGDPSYYNTAYAHAVTAMNTLIRPDAGSYHVAEFDPESGELEKLRTHQGYADESTWARGQAWGICGFAQAFKYTEDPRFYAVSKRMAEYFIERLPEDLVPTWDLDLFGQVDVLRDASAAAIAAFGMFELAEVADLKEDHDRYLTYAIKITTSLLDNYLFTESDRKTEEGLLLHTIYHYHKKWGVDESFPAGDFYLMQALKKLKAYEDEKFFINKNPQRETYCLNKGWDYLEEDIKDPKYMFTATKDWQIVDLPHTWNSEDVMDVLPGYRREGSWYEKCIYIPEYVEDNRLLLSFEGVNTYAKVYVNGKEAGEHIGGYLAFDVDMTPYLKFGEKNKIQVYASNAINMDIVPSQKSDFFIYGGITRDAHLKVLPKTCIERVNVQTPDVSKEMASTKVKVKVKNSSEQMKADLLVEIKDNNDKTVSKLKKKVDLNNGVTKFEFDMPNISDPELWSPDDPVLYTIELQLKSGKIKDKITDKIGYRWFEFKESGPFYLNGERLLIRGTHRHEEHAGVGAAMSNEMHRADMEMIKEMGANFVRLAHYPQDPEVYKACDELGILVWDEVPWCRGGMGEELWQENTMNMLDEMILQNMNHPSIIIWSLGNELYWMPDFPKGGDDNRLRAYLEKMNDRAHELDPTRVTAMRKYYAGADIVDVFSPSIWAGWYSGVYTNFEKALKSSLKKYPFLLHMEYGGSSHVGRHDENPVDGKGWQNTEGWEEAVNQVKIKNIARTGDWSENYIVDLFDWHLSVSEQLDWFTGNAQWAVKDFGTPLRPENAIPYVNQKGIFDRDGKPKDAYYVFKSYWTRGDEHEPFVYIESPTWTERQGPKGKTRNLSIFTNCDEASLVFNGKYLGKKTWDINEFPACGLNWDLDFKAGRNELHAKAYRDGILVAEHDLDILYRYDENKKPERFHITSEKQESGMILVTATARDKDGLRCLDYEEPVYFYHAGDGKLIENQGTPTGSSIIQMANGQASILLKPTAGGSCMIEARNQDFKGDYLKIEF